MQFSTFEHSVAVLLSREAFTAHGIDAHRLYAGNHDYAAAAQSSSRLIYLTLIICVVFTLLLDYLRMVYEALLRDNNIVIEQLRTCAGLTKSAEAPPQKHSLRGESGRGAPSSASGAGVSYPTSSCGSHAVAYNLLLTEQYMMLVPRSAKYFKDEVDVNSFGEARL